MELRGSFIARWIFSLALKGLTRKIFKEVKKKKDVTNMKEDPYLPECHDIFIYKFTFERNQQPTKTKV